MTPPSARPMPSPGTLSVDYDPGISMDDNIIRGVIDYKLGGRTVQPWHPLQQPFAAPFFFDDSQHVFYVTTTDRVVTVSKFDGYVWLEPLPKGSYVIPPLVVEKPKLIPGRIGPVITGPYAGLINGPPIERFISEDAYIRKGLATVSTVQFGKVELGPAGALPDKHTL
jgi:hypothetical protein